MTVVNCRLLFTHKSGSLLRSYAPSMNSMQTNASFSQLQKLHASASADDSGILIREQTIDELEKLLQSQIKWFESQKMPSIDEINFQNLDAKHWIPNVAFKTLLTKTNATSKHFDVEPDYAQIDLAHLDLKLRMLHLNTKYPITSELGPQHTECEHSALTQEQQFATEHALKQKNLTEATNEKTSVLQFKYGGTETAEEFKEWIGVKPTFNSSEIFPELEEQQGDPDYTFRSMESSCLYTPLVPSVNAMELHNCDDSLNSEWRLIVEKLIRDVVKIGCWPFQPNRSSEHELYDISWGIGFVDIVIRRLDKKRICTAHENELKFFSWPLEQALKSLVLREQIDIFATHKVRMKLKTFQSSLICRRDWKMAIGKQVRIQLNDNSSVIGTMLGSPSTQFVLLNDESHVMPLPINDIKSTQYAEKEDMNPPVTIELEPYEKVETPSLDFIDESNLLG